MARLKSSDGDIFEVGDGIVALSPVLASVADSGDGDEIPLPLVDSLALRWVLAHCQEYRVQGRWVLSKKLSKGGPSDLEKLLWAADFLALDRLASLCLAKLAGLLLQEQGTKISLRALCRCLEFGLKLPELAVAVLQAVQEQAAFGDETALSAVSRCRAHAAAAVRLATVKALEMLAPKGHAVVTQCLQSRLQIEAEEEVQLAILLALVKVGAKESASSQASASQNFVDIHNVLRFLGPNCSAAIREAAAQAVGSLAQIGSAQALAALIGSPPVYLRQGITDSAPRVRRESLRSLQQLVGNCKSIHVLSGIAARLQDTDDGVRKEAVKAVALISRPGDVIVIRAALACLGPGCPWALSVGVQALQLVGRGDAAAIAGVLQHMKDPKTRMPAAQALLQISTVQEALRSCISCLVSPDVQMRNSVPECLLILLRQCLSPVGFVSSDLLRYLCHRAFEVRRATLAAFGSLPLAGKKILPTALRGIGCRLLDRHHAVRAAAAELARTFGPEERLRVLSPLTRHLAHRKGRRRLVVGAFRRLATPWDKRYLELLIPSLKSRQVSVQKAGIEIARRLSSGHESTGIEKALNLVQEKCASAKTGGYLLLASMLGRCSAAQNQVPASLLQSAVPAVIAGIQSREISLRCAAAACSPGLSSVVAASADMTASVEWLDVLAAGLVDSSDPSRFMQLSAAAAIQPFLAHSNACSRLALEVIMGAMLHRDWEVRWTAVAALLQVPLDGTTRSDPARMPESLASEIRTAICRLQSEKQQAVRDVADYVLSKGLHGDHQLCQLALRTSHAQKNSSSGCVRGIHSVKRVRRNRVPAQRFAKPLKLGPVQPVRLE